MVRVVEGHHADNIESNAHEQALYSAEEYYDVVFDGAPVMMHAIDTEGKIVKVNRMWLAKLGYAKGEVLGRRSTDFLTDASRLRALTETIPLFWRTGSAHSIGYQLVRKDGRVIDVLLDAEVIPGAPGTPTSIAAVYDGSSLV